MGRFNTPEANELRFKALHSEYLLDVVIAAHGLAIVRPAGGLEILTSVLNENASAGAASIVNAIIAYGSDALPYLEELRMLRDSDDVSENDRNALRAGVLRLEAIKGIREGDRLQ